MLPAVSGAGGAGLAGRIFPVGLAVGFSNSLCKLAGRGTHEDKAPFSMTFSIVHLRYSASRGVIERCMKDWVKCKAALLWWLGLQY